MAAKKSFTDALNPATMFISSAQQSEQETAQANTKLKTNAAPEGYKVNRAFVETKSKRVNLLMQPSLYAKVQAMAAAKGLSVNEFVHVTLENITRED